MYDLSAVSAIHPHQPGQIRPLLASVPLRTLVVCMPRAHLGCPRPTWGGFPQTTSALWWLIRVAAREGRTGCRFGGGRSSAEAATHFTDKDTKIARGRSRLYLSQECRLALPGLVQRGWGWAVMWSEDPWAVGQRTLNQTAWGLQAWGDALSGHRFVPIWKEKESETAERTKLSVGKGPWGRCGVH